MTHLSKITHDHIDSDVAKAMMGQSPDCIKLISSEGQLRFMSDNGQELMEIDDFAKVDGKDWWALWPPEAQHTLRDSITAARRGVSVSFEAACPTAGGTPKHWMVRVSPVQGGEFDGMIIATSQDISEQKALERARSALELDNLALRRFTRFVAHDLRGPIRHHKILSECILSEDEPEDAVDLARQIHRSASELLEMLCGLENLHAAETPADPATISVAGLLERAQSAARRDRPTVTHTGGHCRVLADLDQITSALNLIFENCHKYGTHGTCKIALTARPTPDGQTEITVTDNGPGFAAEQVHDLLKPLARGANSTGVEGAGLGLAIVDQLMRQNGGSVRLGPPEEGAGATVILSLPTARDGVH